MPGAIGHHVRCEVVNALADGPCSLRELYERIGYEYALSTYVSQMVRERPALIQRIARGIYALTPYGCRERRIRSTHA